MIFENENMELYDEERAEFEIDGQDDDDFAISLPLWELNRIILEENYGTFKISPNTGEKQI